MKKMFGIVLLVLMFCFALGTPGYSETKETRFKAMLGRRQGMMKNDNLATDFEKAAYYKKALERKPNNLKYRDSLSLAYYCMGEYKNALEHSNKVIEQSKYVGVGMRVGLGTQFPIIVEVFKDMPAEKAGAMVDDEIIKINGISMKNKTVAQAVGYLKGAKGIKVKVLVRRNKRKYNLVMTRELIGLPDSEENAERLSRRCLIYRKMGETEKAMQDAKHAIKMAPDFSKAKTAFGAVNLDAGDYKQAIEILSKAEQEDAFVLILTAIAYAKSGDIKKARQLYEEKIAPDESFLKKIPYISEQKKLFDALAQDTESMLVKARQFADKGKFQEALDEYSRAMLFMGKDDKEKIRDKLFQITFNMSSPPEISKLARKHVLRAKLLVKEGKFKDAIAEFKKAIVAAPYSAKLYLDNALVLGELEDYKQAIEQMNIYIKAVPQAPNIQQAEDQIIKWEFELERKK
ncbi:MAG: tetratricopeptide repeat protein [Candidatus Omnitrophica bacterium]|nr:tetratricopeptide repeat protein [Candidatus Omnitrophota bacterium]